MDVHIHGKPAYQAVKSGEGTAGIKFLLSSCFPPWMPLVNRAISQEKNKRR